MWDEIQELFHSSPPPTPRGQKKTSQQIAIEKECKLWRDNFPSLRVVGKAMKIERAKKPAGVNSNSGLSVTGRQSNVLRRSGSVQRMRKNKHKHEATDNVSEAEDCEETYAEHGHYVDTDNVDERGRHISDKFESNPSQYLEEKMMSAMFDNLLVSVAPELEPVVTSYQDKLRSGDAVMMEAGWEEAVREMRSRHHQRDSLEEDSIFSLGKIIASPRYGQYPDLSDDDDDQVHLSLPHDPSLSLPTLHRHVPMSAPPVRVLQPPTTTQPPATSRTKRSNSFKTDQTTVLSRHHSERRKIDYKKQNRSLERTSKPSSSTSVRSTAK